MYGKIKYFIYAAFILIIVFVIMDASNRYTKMAEQKNPQQTIQDEAFRRAQLAVENQNQRDNDRQNAQYEQEEAAPITDPNNQAVQNNIEQQETTLAETPEEIMKRSQYGSIKEDNSSPDDDIEEGEINQGYFTFESGEKAEQYKLYKGFTLMDENSYAVVSYVDPATVNQNSSYINEKFYLYKLVNGKYYRSNYLFDNASTKAQYNAKEKNDDESIVTLQEEKYEIVLNYNNKITRRINKNQLNTNYYQYKSLPALILKQTETPSENTNEDNSEE